MFVSCAKLTAELALKQGVLNGCDGNPLAAGTEMATCADLAAVTVTVPDATDTVKGIAALNQGTSLPADATNCTDALTACGLNAILADTAAGGNAVINAIKALDIDVVVPLATTTVAGLIEEATGEETRLGATDPNKDDRAVTPGSMSYALQTGKDYKIVLYGSATNAAGMVDILNQNTSGAVAIGTQTRVANGATDVQAGRFLVTGGTHSTPTGIQTPRSEAVSANYAGVVSSGAVAAAVGGSMSATGDGIKHGVMGKSIGAGGTNIGVYGTAANGTTNWAGYFDGNVAGGAYTTLSDATLKEDVQPIDPAKALQFRNGLSWKKYEMFTEQQVQIMDEVTEEVQKTDAEGNPVVDSEGNPVMETVITQVPTGRYEVKRNSQGIKRGLIAQEVLALAQSIGDFADVVVEVGEYFTLDAQGYPVKDAQGNNIVNKRLGIDYDAVSFCVMCAEQSLTLGA
jgi:hypothetical protein